MLNCSTSRLLTLPMTCMIALALCMTVGCKREPEEVAQTTAVSDPVTGPVDSANSSATQGATPNNDAEASKTLAERWIDVDLPIDEGPSPSLRPSNVAYLRLRLGDDGRWNLAMSKSSRFKTTDAESVLGAFEAIAHGSKSTALWNTTQNKKFEEQFEHVKKIVRAAIMAQENVQSVQISMSDKPNESSLLHIDKTAPVALVTMVVDAVYAVRDELQKTGTKTPLSVTFRNSFPEAIGRGTSADANAERAEPHDSTTAPEQSIIYPISKSGIARDKTAKDALAVYVYNTNPEAPTTDGWRIRLGTANAKSVTEVAALREELKAAIATIGAGNTDELGLSNLRLMIHADYRAPSHFHSVIMSACMHGDVRIAKMSLASLTPGESQRR